MIGPSLEGMRRWVDTLFFRVMRLIGVRRLA